MRPECRCTCTAIGLNSDRGVKLMLWTILGVMVLLYMFGNFASGSTAMLTMGVIAVLLVIGNAIASIFIIGSEAPKAEIKR